MNAFRSGSGAQTMPFQYSQRTVGVGLRFSALVVGRGIREDRDLGAGLAKYFGAGEQQCRARLWLRAKRLERRCRVGSDAVGESHGGQPPCTGEFQVVAPVQPANVDRGQVPARDDLPVNWPCKLTGPQLTRILITFAVGLSRTNVPRSSGLVPSLKMFCWSFRSAMLRLFVLYVSASGVPLSSVSRTRILRADSLVSINSRSAWRGEIPRPCSRPEVVRRSIMSGVMSGRLRRRRLVTVGDDASRIQ